MPENLKRQMEESQSSSEYTNPEEPPQWCSKRFVLLQKFIGEPVEIELSPVRFGM